jgi:hypothetical protein
VKTASRYTATTINIFSFERADGSNQNIFKQNFVKTATALTTFKKNIGDSI